jgi:hypothetical protein
VSKLVIFRGDAVENEIHLGSNPLRIGRDARNDIVLDDKSVTRFHAEVRAEGGTYYIVDLKSRNGVWMNGQQIKGKAALPLGVTVTVGAYELALEDDVSTGDLGEAPLLNRTAVSPAAVDRSDRPSSRSATQRMAAASPASAAKKSALFWSGLVVATLLLCGLTYAVIRYMLRPASVEVAANIPPAPPEPEPPPQAPPVDLTREAIVRHLAEARAAIDSRDYTTALRDHLSPVLELDPANQEALDLKRQAEEAAALVPAPRPPAPKPEVPKEVETPGIPRRAGEAWPDYTARVARVQVNFQEGNRSLERQDFALAVARFQLVERDQRGYQGVDSLITETTARQKRLVEEAIDAGNKNEQAGKIADAVRWYQQAQRLDATSTIAHDKIASLSERLTKEGLDAFSRAEVFRKRNDYPKAIEFYKQAANLLPGTHEKNREAKQWLEKLTP